MQDKISGTHDRAIRLFRFLKELTELRIKTIRTLENYEVLWLNDIPREEGCFCTAWPGISNVSEENWVEVEKPRLFPPPHLPEELKPWLDPKQIADSSIDFPELREHIVETKRETDEAEGEIAQQVTVYLNDRPEIKDLWEQYVEKSWWPWAEKDKQLKPVQKVYTDLFSIYQKQQRLGEMYEVVLGMGLLLWKTPGGQAVYRHLVTAQVNLDFDSARGIITVGIGSDGAKLTLEQDMLEATERPPAAEQRSIEEELKEIGDNVWEKERLEATLKSWIHSVSSRGSFVSGLSVPPMKNIKTEPHVCFAPALILRKRNERNLIQVFQEIIKQLQEGGEVPVGIKRLVEIVDDYSPDIFNNKPVPVEEIYFPRESNPEQQEIIHRLASRHGVLVQGPPGTGKSHTIANLVCHLLASGKRVLVTSQAPRALKVLSRMIPKEIAALCVSLLGYDQAALQDLEDCVLGITDKYNHWDPNENHQRIEKLEDLLDKARRKEAEVLRELRSLREEETFEYTLKNGNYQGTLASVAQKLKEEERRYAWIGTLENDDINPLLSADEALELLRILRELNDDRKIEVQKKLVESSRLLEPAEFMAQVRSESATYSDFRETEKNRNLSFYPLLLKTEQHWRKSLHELLKELEAFYRQLHHHPRQWVRQAALDILSGQESKWRELLKFTEEQLQRIDHFINQAANSVNGIDNLNRERVKTDAFALLQHLEAGRGMGLGPFQPRVVKESRYLLKNVYVDGQPCNNINSLKKLLNWLGVDRVLDALNKHWGSFEEVSGPFTAQIFQYKDLTGILNRIMLLREKVDHLGTMLKSVSGLQEPAWHDLEEVSVFREALRATFCEEELQKAAEPFCDLENLMQKALLQENVHPVIERLLNAVQERYVKGYSEAYQALCSLENDAAALDKSEQLLNCLKLSLPVLADCLLSTYFEPAWNERLPCFEEAWNWASASRWLEKKIDPAALDRLTAELAYYRSQIQTIMTQLVETKAWGHFFSRLEEEQRQHLMAWTYSMRKIGKGTGKYTAQYRQEAREHMDRCRPAIPAWIMPIFRVAESVRPGIDAFDVVIVDEASQSGPEALFLHYLAPKIIVVGDDKQISPEHVGVNREQVNILRERHIGDLPLSDMYSLENSFFDQAVTRFGGRIRLKEHFRCMPEIIQFSNNICYRAEPLIPLRQRAAGRLNPIMVTHVPDGYRRGTGNRIENPPEAEAIVMQIIRCVQDPAYKDKTIGVISLQGELQARRIESLLLEHLDPEEMERRQLICGDAYAFQGDERDIIFLSLVAAPDENRRIGTLSSDRDQRRFNVAASRAKDQMWLFHTATLNDLSTACYRYNLLQYCLDPKLESITFEGEILDPNTLVQPFESLFEQHVFYKIKEWGYRVVPQYNVAGYRIDLVVSGMQGQLAVECDGDRWHGPEQYEADMERQRQLERCGWTFWRIRASSFYRDPDGAMETLWEKLNRLNIYPSTEDERKGMAKDKDEEAVSMPVENGDITEKRKDDDAFEIRPINGFQGKVISLNERRKADKMDNSDDNAKAKTIQNPDVKEYTSWEPEPLPDPRDASLQEIIEGLVKIVAVEGPIFVHRVFRLYLKAAGLGRLGDYLKNALLRALQKAITKGLLVESNELEVRDKLARVVRLPNTPRVILRTRGDRALEEIPPSEITAVINLFHKQNIVSLDEKEMLFRAVLDHYGFGRMTQKARQILKSTLQMAQQGNEFFRQ
jgi:superfamily I DNA and/or RNA helicase